MMISNVLKALETKWYVTRIPADKIVVVAKNKKKDLTGPQAKEMKEDKDVKPTITGNVLWTTSQGKDLIKTLCPVVEKFEKEVFGKANKKFTKGLESIVDQLSA